MLLWYSDASPVVGCYSCLRMLGIRMASHSSLRSQHIPQSHLSLGYSLMIECFACLWMLFLFSNAKNYPGFTELGSLAKIYFQSHLSLGVTLIVRCFISLCYYSCFPMLVILLASHSSLRSQHFSQSHLSLGYFSDDRMLCLSLDALLDFQC